MKDFAAIDFETANGQRSSVCSVCVVVVRGGEVVDTFYSLIQPEPNYYAWFCQRVHGLGHEDTDDATCPTTSCIPSARPAGTASRTTTTRWPTPKPVRR